MSLLLSKLLPLLVYPLGLALLLLLLALLARVLSWPRLSLGSMLLALLVLWLSATPQFAEALAGSLERRHVPLALSEVPAADCAILLGGALGQPVPPRQSVNFHEAVDRVIMSGRLLREGKVSAVIIAAGNIPWHEATAPEAELIADFLVELGAEREQLSLDRLSRNTRENALNVRPLLEQRQCRSVLLVTSALHMPRAMAVFARAGVVARAFPVDILVIEKTSGSVFDWLPSVEALHLSTSALREYIGWLVYRLRGWA